MKRHLFTALFLCTLGATGCAHQSAALSSVAVSSAALMGNRVALVLDEGIRLGNAGDLVGTTLIDNDPAAANLSWSPDGGKLAYWRDGELWLWREQTSRMVWKVETETMSRPRWTWRSFWDPDGSLLAVKSGQGSTQLYHVNEGGEASPVESRLCHRLDTVRTVLVQEEWVAVVSRDDYGDALDLCVRRASKSYSQRSSWHWRIQDHSIGAVAFEKDNTGLYVAVLNPDGESSIYFLNIAEQSEDKEWSGDARVLAIQPIQDRVLVLDRGRPAFRPL